ncbi:MAG: hypothetical protein ACF8R7_06205, partial [Phycisphaerales bacterium JB039]
MQDDLRDPMPALRRHLDAMDAAIGESPRRPRLEEYGQVMSVSRGVAHIDGLPGVRFEELVTLGRGVSALALDLRERSVGLAQVQRQRAD